MSAYKTEWARANRQRLLAAWTTRIGAAFACTHCQILKPATEFAPLYLKCKGCCRPVRAAAQRNRREGNPRVEKPYTPVRPIVGETFNDLTVVGQDRSALECLCVCGAVTKIARSNVVSGATLSCGCRRAAATAARVASGQLKKLSAADLAINNRYCGYAGSARKRGISFNISRDFFARRISEPCFYCNSLGDTNRKDGFTCNGIDRIDNDLGYEPANCLPCCRTCNYAKRDLTLVQFNDWVERLVVRKLSAALEGHATESTDGAGVERL